MTFDDFFFLSIVLAVFSGLIYFIIQLVKGGVKRADYKGDPNQVFGNDNYCHYRNSSDTSSLHDLQHRYSYRDEYNISSGRLPGSE